MTERKSSVDFADGASDGDNNINNINIYLVDGLSSEEVFPGQWLHRRPS